MNNSHTNKAWSNLKPAFICTGLALLFFALQAPRLSAQSTIDITFGNKSQCNVEILFVPCSGTYPVFNVASLTNHTITVPVGNADYFKGDFTGGLDPDFDGSFNDCSSGNVTISPNACYSGNVTVDTSNPTHYKVAIW